MADTQVKRHPAPASGGELLLARRYKRPEMPSGFLWLWKYLPVPPGHHSLAIAGGHVMGGRAASKDRRTLRIGFVPFYFRRQAVTIYAGPFVVEPELSLHTGDLEAVAVFAPMKIQISDPIAFYGQLGEESWPDYRMPGLSTEVAGSLRKTLQGRLMDYGLAALLNDDGTIGGGIATQVQDGLRTNLAARGIALQEIWPLRFLPYQEPLDEAADVDELKEREKQEELATRARQLQEVSPGQRPAGPTPTRRRGKVGIYASVAMIIVGLYLFLAVFTGAQRNAASGAGVAGLVGIGLIMLLLSVLDHVIVRAIGEPLSRFLDGKGNTGGNEPSVSSNLPALEPAPPAPGTAPPKSEFLEKWLRQDFLKADRTVRDQAARELHRAEVNLREASLKDYQSGNKTVSDCLKDLAGATGTLRVTVAAAPRNSRVMKQWKDSATHMAAKVIEFEEKLLRQAEVFSLATERMVAGAEGPRPSVENLETMLRGMERHW